MSVNTVQLPPTESRPVGSNRSSARTAAAVVIGTFGVLLALAGIAAIAAHLFLRDDEGYFTKGAELETSSYALATDRIHLDEPGAAIPDALLGDFRVTAEPSGGAPLFLGIAPTAAARRYLDGVAHARVADLGDPVYEDVAGRAPRTAPGSERFWAAESRGPGLRRIDWELEQGDWTIVAMNADRSRGVAVDGELGVRASWVLWLGLGSSLLGFAGIGAAVALRR